MITFEELGEMLDEIADSMPYELYRDLNGGLSLLPQSKVHPAHSETRSSFITALSHVFTASCPVSSFTMKWCGYFTTRSDTIMSTLPELMIWAIGTRNRSAAIWKTIHNLIHNPIIASFPVDTPETRLFYRQNTLK